VTGPPRTYLHEERSYDLVVVGGGMAGITAAVAAARRGVSVALVHDRPVLGGNGSSEIRVNLEGANGGAHARFFVESGIPEDLLLENLWRNPTGSADHWSALLLELVLGQENLELFLDTHVHGVSADERGGIDSVDAITLASERTWTLRGRIFVDSTGDATIAYLAGAEFMRGEEDRSIFDEPLAPLEPNDFKLGGTMWFMCKDTGRPVHFVPPAFARTVDPKELRVHRAADVWDQDPVLGGFWWIEYGGALDTISDNEEIKRVLLSELFGVWDHVKNSPDLRERNRNLDLEWVAAMPGKRESRRVIGDYVLREQDLMSRNRFDDAVAFGGWSIDRHPPGGFLDFEEPPSVHVYTPGVYQIPLRSLYSRDVGNLFLAGRDISASHVASCSARVQLTCMSIGEAVGAAAAACLASGVTPRTLAETPERVGDLQRDLQRFGKYIPSVPLTGDRLPPGSTVTASSESELAQPEVEATVSLGQSRMLSLPVTAASLDTVAVWIASEQPAAIEWRLFDRDPDGFWLPGAELRRGLVEIEAQPEGAWIELPVATQFDEPPGYVHIGLGADDPGVQLGISHARPLGPLSWRSYESVDARPEDRRAELGWRSPHHSYIVSFWSRADHYWGGPPGPAIAFDAQPRQHPATALQILDPWERPTPEGVHGWSSGTCEGTAIESKYVFDTEEWLEVEFPEPLYIESVDIYFNSDVDRHLANLWYSYPPGFRAMSTLVADFDLEVQLTDGSRSVVAQVRDNHHRRFCASVEARIAGFRVRCLATNGERFASIADLRIRR
jgi:hypothetical protein